MSYQLSQEDMPKQVKFLTSLLFLIFDEKGGMEFNWVDRFVDFKAFLLPVNLQSCRLANG
jgi:hypothetical protein